MQEEGEELVQVARNGQPLGNYEADKIGDLIEMGRLLSTDHFFDEKARVWRPLSEWTGILTVDELKTIDETGSLPSGEKAEGSGRSRRRKKGRGKSQKADKTAIFALIGCLLALGIAGGLWAWAQTLKQSFDGATEQIRFLNEKMDALNKEKQLLSEIAPSGRIRGIFTYEPSLNQAAIISGATVGLYRRADVEAAVNQIVSEQPLSAGNFDDAIEKLKTAIAAPLKISLSDSNGRFDLDVPEPGDYVLVASAGKKIGDIVQRYVWLVGFHAENQPSTLVMLNDKNALSSSRPRLAIVTLPSFAWKGYEEETSENASSPTSAPSPNSSPGLP